MKKELTIFLLIINIIVFSYLISAEINSSITGEVITGKITNANIAVSITITIGEPSLTIIIPENHTYLTSKNLQLNFTSENTQTIWYNLDNQANTTIIGSTIFNTTQGQHTLYLYANNTDGNKTSANTTFTVDSSKFRVIYNEYKGNKKGSSNNFNQSSYENLQNMQDIILENFDWGKIKFNEIINMTNDVNTSDNEVNLDINTNISSNRIELNSTALPNFNKTVTLWLYNLSFNNPRILRDGIICPASICTFESFESNTLKFNVTQFTIYSAEETPSGETPSGEIPNGGGGSGRVIKEFNINPENIHISLKQGETKEITFTLKNTGTKSLNIEIEKSDRIKDFIRLEETSFTLKRRESKTIKLDVLAKEDTTPNLYIGKLLIKEGGIEKEILVVIEIESRESLLDVNVEIPNKYKRIMPGKEILSEIKIYNMGETGRVDIEIEYIIKDENNNILIKESETIAVETQASFMQKITIPENTKYGKYFFYVKAIYNSKIASSSTSFEVVKEEISQKEKIYIGVILVLIIVISMGIYVYLKHKKLIKTTPNQVGLRDIFKKKK